MASKSDPNYGKGVARVAHDDDVLLDEEAVAARLRETFAAPDYEPPKLPSVAAELMSLAQTPDVEIDQVARLLERDPMIAGRVVQLAQSPIYRGSGAVTSIREALMRLGLNALRDLVLQVSLNTRVFRADAYAEPMDRLRRHSLATAHLAKIVCRYTALHGDYAFLCGLLHDVGIAGCLIALAEGKDKRPPDLVAVWPSIERVHSEAGVHMARLWQLPDEIEWVLGAHHEVLIGGAPHPLAAAVALANEIAIRQGFTLVPEEEPDESAADEDGDEDGKLAADVLERLCLAAHTNLDRTRPGVLEQATAAVGLTAEQLTLIERDFEELVPELRAG